MANRIQIRRDTASNWNSVDPILADGEPGLNIDTNQLKYGDGNTNWSDLPYQFPSGGIIMWSGAVNDIPNFWVLCDGQNGTPDLRNRFVVGAGDDYAVAATGGSTDAVVVEHKHWISGAPKDDANFTSQGSNSQEYGIWADSGSYDADDPNHAYGRNSLTTGVSGTNANLPPYYALCFIMKT